MTSTFTATSTYTYARLQLLKLQIEIAIRRIGGVSASFQQSILNGLDKRLIGEVSFYALDASNLCRAQLDLTIDWARHELEVTSGRATVTIDGRWRESAAIEVDAAIDLFNRYVHENSLSSRCLVSYARGVDGTAANRELGLKDAEPMKWAEGDRVTRGYNIPELKELRVGLRLLDR